MSLKIFRFSEVLQLIVALGCMYFPYKVIGGGWSWQNREEDLYDITEADEENDVEGSEWIYGKDDLTYNSLNWGFQGLTLLVFWISGKVAGFRVPQYLHMYGWIAQLVMNIFTLILGESMMNKYYIWSTGAHGICWLLCIIMTLHTGCGGYDKLIEP